MLNKRLQAGYVATAQLLQGSERRLFMARVVKTLGPGGQRYAERELGWNRGTIRKGLQELESGRLIRDNFAARGRKPVEEHLPGFLDDLRAVVESRRQLASHRTTLSCPQIRQALIRDKGYADSQLPSNETIRRKVHQLGYRFAEGQG